MPPAPPASRYDLIARAAVSPPPTTTSSLVFMLPPWSRSRFLRVGTAGGLTSHDRDRRLKPRCNANFVQRRPSRIVASSGESEDAHVQVSDDARVGTELAGY